MATDGNAQEVQIFQPWRFALDNDPNGSGFIS